MLYTCVCVCVLYICIHTYIHSCMHACMHAYIHTNLPESSYLPVGLAAPGQAEHIQVTGQTARVDQSGKLLEDQKPRAMNLVQVLREARPDVVDRPFCMARSLRFRPRGLL